MKQRKFSIGQNIWFVLHYTDGVITAIEEHDWRGGGHISQDSGRTWDDTFVEHATRRASAREFKATVKRLAKRFLTTDDVEVDILKK